MPTNILMPALSPTMEKGNLAKWLKKEGDAIEKDETLVELETDKVNVELPAPASGRMGKMLKQAGQKAKVGEVIAYIESNGATSASPS